MIKQIVLAFFGSIFPAILFNIDRKKLSQAGLCGAIGWTTYLLIYRYNHSFITGCFAGAFVVGIYSEFMSRKFKTPVVQFSIPGIFPLVPGITAYNTISSIAQHDYSAAYSKGIQTLASGGAIAFGIMFSSTTFRLLLRIIKLTQDKKRLRNE